jgi:transcriptional regulator NrdR family protein
MTKVIVHHRRDQYEAFSPDKLRSSLLHSALANGVPEGQAEEIARLTTQQVEQWLVGRSAVAACDIRRAAAKFLKPLHPDAAFFYAHHDKII